MQYRAENKEKVCKQRVVSKHNCQWDSSKGRFTVAEWEGVLKSAKNRCLCCHKHASETKEGKLTIDHVRPVEMGGTNKIENIQPLCKSCNTAKGHRYVDYRPNSLNSESAVKIEGTPRVPAVPIKSHDDGSDPCGAGAPADAWAVAQTKPQTTAAASSSDSAAEYQDDDGPNWLLNW